MTPSPSRASSGLPHRSEQHDRRRVRRPRPRSRRGRADLAAHRLAGSSMTGAGLSPRTLAIGCAFGAVLAAAGLYTVSKTSSADQGSIPAALLGYAILSTLARSGPRPSPDEGNLIQTIASTAAMTAITGGVSGPITALV